jgi:hypothetical protein
LNAKLPVVSVDRVDDRILRLKFAGGLDIQQTLPSESVNLKIGVVSYKPVFLPSRIHTST